MDVAIIILGGYLGKILPWAYLAALVALVGTGWWRQWRAFAVYLLVMIACCWLSRDSYTALWGAAVLITRTAAMYEAFITSTRVWPRQYRCFLHVHLTVFGALLALIAFHKVAPFGVYSAVNVGLGGMAVAGLLHRLLRPIAQLPHIRYHGRLIGLHILTYGVIEALPRPETELDWYVLSVITRSVTILLCVAWTVPLWDTIALRAKWVAGSAAGRTGRVVSLCRSGRIAPAQAQNTKPALSYKSL
jgi:hypothetical protein